MEQELEDADIELKERTQAGSEVFKIVRPLGTSSNCNLVIILNKVTKNFDRDSNTHNISLNTQHIHGTHTISVEHKTHLWNTQHICGTHNISVELTTFLWNTQHFSGTHKMSLEHKKCLWNKQRVCVTHNITMEHTTYLLNT